MRLRSQSAAAFVVAILFVAWSAAVDSARAAPLDHSGQAESTAPAGAPTPNRYYVEFRVATIGTYGHSYIAYGRLNAKGQPAERNFADLHPIGNYALMALGHLVPVPATTKWDPDVEKLPIYASWRRPLTAAEYKKLLAAIQRARANASPTWNAMTNNCNHFVGALAKEIGLKTPNNFQVSYTFIPALRDLNATPKDKARDASKEKQAASHEPR